MKQSLSGRLIRSALLTVLPILIVLVAIVYLFAYRQLVEQMDQQTGLLGDDTVHRIRLVLEPVADIPQALAVSISRTSLDEDTLNHLLRESVQLNPNVFGMAFGLEPGVMKRHERYCPYVYRVDGEIRSRRLDSPEYRYWALPWYRLPLDSGKSMWSEPYYDEGGGDVLMSTYSVPVIGDRRALGIVTADISLERLKEIVSSIRILDTGYAMLVSGTGRLIVYPDQAKVMKETIGSLGNRLNNPSLVVLGEEMVSGRTGQLPVTGLRDGRSYRVYFRPVAKTGWSLGIVMPEEELYAPLHRLTRIMLGVSVIGILLILTGITLVARRATSDIQHLSRIAGRVSTGDLDVPVPETFSTSELVRLASSFRTMQVSLQEHIRDLMETTAVRERMAGELQVAHNIQMGILPKIFPPFPDRYDMDVFALIEPAREVGGDFYDFFFVDDDHFCFVIGDVSGKGVPASLYMAVAKTLLKASAEPDLDPGAILEKVNVALAEGDNRSMFVTVFMGILNVRTGNVSYANGGHNLPYLLSDKDIDAIPKCSGMALGAWRKATFETASLQLQPEQSLFCFTDGVTEAFNTDDEQYGEQRLENALRTLPCETAEQLIGDVKSNVADFTGDTPPSDDITMLMVRWLGKRS